MRISKALCLLLLGAATTVDAQIRVLWRGGLTNSQLATNPPNNSTPPKQYGATAAAVDGAGNTIVAGRALLQSSWQRAAFAAKINAQGATCWEYFVGSNAWAGVDVLEVDRRGNTLFAARLWPWDPYPLTLIKLSPDGQELWRVDETHAPYGSTSALKTDYLGNVFLLKAWVGHPRHSGLELLKFSSAGRLLWRSRLPPQRYFCFGDSGGRSKCLSVLPDGSAIVAGAYHPAAEGSNPRGVGFVAKFDLYGRLAWWTDEQEVLSDPPQGRPRRIRVKLPFFTSVLAGRYGTLCAGAPGQGFVILSLRGQVLAVGHTKANLAGEVEYATPWGGFLLGCSGYVAEVDALGRILWEGRSNCRVAGMAPNRLGWLAAGPGGIGMQQMSFSQFNWWGQRLWTLNLEDHFYTWSNPSPFHRAPDGTLRLVHVRQYWYPTEQYPGVAVTALALEPPAHNNPSHTITTGAPSFNTNALGLAE